MPTETRQDIPDLGRIDVSDPNLYATDSWRPLFDRLRTEAPVHYCADSAYGPYWSVSTHDLITKAELDTAHFSNRADLGGIQINDIAQGLSRPAFISMDKPDHTPRRRAVAPIGNRGGLQAFEDLIRERTVTLLEGIAVGEEFDWVPRVSIDLTSMMLATMLDFPQEQRHDLMYWSDVATSEPQRARPAGEDRGRALRGAGADGRCVSAALGCPQAGRWRLRHDFDARQ